MFYTPTTQVLDRRRTRRYRLQPNIAISFFSGDDNNKTSHGEGKLLNLSLHGMACKVSISTCQALEISQGFYAQLDISDPACQLQMPCQLVNATAGAEENENIVGIEFSGAVNDSLRDQLSEVLRRREK